MAPSPAESNRFPPIRACLFDMDGLLIDSEDKYTTCTNTILHENGRPSLPWSIKAQLQGRPGPAAGKIFYEWAKLPIAEVKYLARLKELQREHFPTVQPLPGVVSLLDTLSSTPSVHIALATSSHAANYELKTSHLKDLFSVFPPSQCVLGDDPRIGAGRGKPLPDIYLLALETINAGIRERGEREIRPEECLVFEDSVPGVEAGRRAGMRVVWCPHEGLLGEYKGREEEVLAGLTGCHPEDDEKEGERIAESLNVGGAGGKDLGLTDGATNSPGWPGKIGDGWGNLYISLEGFPYEKYGIKPSH